MQSAFKCSYVVLVLETLSYTDAHIITVLLPLPCQYCTTTIPCQYWQTTCALISTINVQENTENVNTKQSHLKGGIKKRLVLKSCNLCIQWHRKAIYISSFYLQKTALLHVTVFKYFFAQIRLNNTTLKMTMNLSDNIQFCI